MTSEPSLHCDEPPFDTTALLGRPRKPIIRLRTSICINATPNLSAGDDSDSATFPMCSNLSVEGLLLTDRRRSIERRRPTEPVRNRSDKSQKRPHHHFCRRWQGLRLDADSQFTVYGESTEARAALWGHREVGRSFSIRANLNCRILLQKTKDADGELYVAEDVGPHEIYRRK